MRVLASLQFRSLLALEAGMARICCATLLSVGKRIDPWI